MKRNPAANCGNCPFWASWTGTGSPDHIGECRQTSVKPHDTNQRWETTGANDWCGQHPDFRTPAPALLDEIEQLRARVAELEAAKKTCRWHETNTDEYPGVYTTGCGHMFSFNEGDRADNGAVYCQYCGGLVQEGEEEE